MSNKKRTPDGMHVARLREDHHGRETAFARLWEQDNANSCTGTVLKSLLTQICNAGEPGAERVWDFGLGITHLRKPLGEVTERDEIVAATIIQWLGTNVGFDFVGRALEQSGYPYPQRVKPLTPKSGK